MTSLEPGSSATRPLPAAPVSERWHAAIAQRVEALPVRTAIVLPGGQRLGAEHAEVTLRLSDHRQLALLAAGQMGRLAEEYVEGRMGIDGPLRALMELSAALIPEDPTQPSRLSAVARWWTDLVMSRWSLRHHTREKDRAQVQFHYDVSDDFYALWLDPRRVYSCAYFPSDEATLAQAQEAKLDLICRKLMLKPGERFLDIGAGWGGLLLWAAQHYGVRAHGVTLSQHQHAHVNRLIDELGLRARVRMELLDYRDIPERGSDHDGSALGGPYDKVASIGMFEHVGRVNLVPYFEKIRRLLAPGGLILNHGITKGGRPEGHFGGGIGDFMDRYIFPGGELVHAAHVAAYIADAGLELVDTENLRPHYAKTLWAWSDGLEAQLPEARRIVDEKTVRAYRLYLAGCAMAFERGWMSLHQFVATRPDGVVGPGAGLRGAQSVYPFRRDHIHR